MPKVDIINSSEDYAEVERERGSLHRDAVVKDGFDAKALREKVVKEKSKKRDRVAVLLDENGYPVESGAVKKHAKGKDASNENAIKRQKECAEGRARKLNRFIDPATEPYSDEARVVLHDEEYRKWYEESNAKDTKSYRNARSK